MNKIAELNDRFRQGDSSLGITRTTCRVKALELDHPEQFAQLRQMVKNFDAFSEANDPYKEHDGCIPVMQ